MVKGFKDVDPDPTRPTLPRIETMWAYVSVDPSDGSEGIIAMATSFGVVPMVASDETRVRSLRPRAVAAAKDSGCIVRLAKFSVREDLEEITGGDDGVH